MALHCSTTLAAENTLTRCFFSVSIGDPPLHEVSVRTPLKNLSEKEEKQIHSLNTF
jgi:hypothetical protein